MTSAACPLPDGSLCGTCPDCQADAINDAQWPDGGISVVLPERAAATAPSRTKLARARQAVKLLAGLRRDFDRAARETAGYESKRYVAFGGAGIVCVAASGPEATELRHKVEEWGGKVQEVPDAKLA